MIYFVFLASLIQIHAKTEAPCGALPPPLDWAQMASVRDLADKVAPPDLDDILSFLGTCDEHTGDPNTIIRQMRAKLSDPNAALGRRPTDGDWIKGGLPDVRKEDHTPGEIADFLAVDAVARTLFSEVGTQPKCGALFIAANGRLMLNRAEAARTSASKQNLWARRGTNDIGHVLADVVFSPKQYQVWDARKPANHSAMCPATQLSQKYLPDENGKKRSSGTKSNGEWLECVGVAAYMVFREKQFREITSGMDAVNYTSGKAEELRRCMEGYSLVPVKMHGRIVPNDPACMQFWDNPRAPVRRTKEECVVPPSI